MQFKIIMFPNEVKMICVNNRNLANDNGGGDAAGGIDDVIVVSKPALEGRGEPWSIMMPPRHSVIDDYNRIHSFFLGVVSECVWIHTVYLYILYHNLYVYHDLYV